MASATVNLYPKAAPILTPSTLGDASVSIAVASGSEFILPRGTLTANRTLTLSTTGAVTGEVVRVTREDSTAFTLAIVNGGAGAGTLYTFPVSVTRVADFRFDGTNWALSGNAAISV